MELKDPYHPETTVSVGRGDDTASEDTVTGRIALDGRLERVSVRNNLFELARSFPTLRDVPPEFFEERRDLGAGAVGFNRDDGGINFALWAASSQGGGGTDAALFVLSVWNTGDDWSEWISRGGPDGGRFNLHRALGNWDSAHRAAFLAWARAPWWL